jgi:hypothetical protein
MKITRSSREWFYYPFFGKHYLYILIVILKFVALKPCHSQEFLFSDEAINVGLNFQYGMSIFGNGLSFYDYDQDGWDDLTLSRPTYETIIYKNINGYFSAVAQIPTGLETKSLIWVDLDNDGRNDLLATSKDQGIKIFRNIDNWSFENYSSNLNWSFDQDFQLWGAAVSDINYDGLLDIYVCNYSIDSFNKTFINLGNFNFAPNNTIFPNEYLRHSFQGSFIPLNNDKTHDLYVINDFETGNVMYISEPDSFFSDQSSIMGLEIPSDAMCNSWSDFDHDGDWDVYITNTISGNRLMINDGSGIFHDRALERQCTVNSWCWSGLWLDYDNDGWEDLWVTNDIPLAETTNIGNHLLKNNNGFFSNQNPGESAHIDGYTSAKGDFNKDGKYDIIYQPKENFNIRLLKNTNPTANKSVNVTLHGVYSNKQAIGSIVKYYHQDFFSQTILQMGENYLNQNSQHLILGLANDSLIDSLIIEWPSGIIEKHFNLQSEQEYNFYEGETLSIYDISMVDSCSADSGFNIQFNSVFNIYSLNSSVQSLGNNLYWAPTAGNWDFLHCIFHTIKIPIGIAIQEPYSPLLNSIMPTCIDSHDGKITWYTPDEIWYNYLDSLNAGTYVVEIDLGSCIWTDTLLLTPQETLLLDSIQITHPACLNLPDGSITPFYNANTTGVTWSIDGTFVNGQLDSGFYQIRLTSPGGCFVMDSVQLNYQIDIPAFETESVLFCSTEFLNFENFSETLLFNEWSLLGWNINASQDSLTIQYVHPNGCPVSHPVAIDWIEAPSPTVDTLWGVNQNALQWQVNIEVEVNFDIYWEDGSNEWEFNHICGDSTYFVLESNNICSWTFPLFSICPTVQISEINSEPLIWQWCDEELKCNMIINEEIEIYNYVGQLIRKDHLSPTVNLPNITCPRWVKHGENLYPITWCLSR